MVWRPQMHEETRFYGNFAAGFALNPLRINNVTDVPDVRRSIEDPVQGQILLYPSLGVEISRRVGFNVMLPIIPYQFTGEDPVAEGVGNGGLTGTNTAIMDLRLDTRVLVWESNSRRTRFGGGGAVWLPTGTETGFGSDRALTGMLYASGEHDFQSFLLTGMIGPHFRPHRMLEGDASALALASELRYALGGFVPLRDGKIRLGLELWGTTGIEKVTPVRGGEQSTFFGSNNTTLEWLAQGRFLLDKRERVFANVGAGTRLTGGYGAADVRVLASIGTYLTLEDFKPGSPPPRVRVVPDVEDHDPDSDGDGYPDSIDKCPTIPEDGKPPAPSDGCPAPVDSDGDGIPDHLDKCPNEAEDMDGIQDSDGCPEKDADNDTIPDKEDACPTEPGPRSKIAEKNGCPTLTKVTEDGEVTLMQPIEFDTGKATIKPGSFPILDEVVTLMKARPDIRMQIHGHTDNRGGHDMNVQLSKDRAASVLNYLKSKGIQGSRLESDGFGPDKPKTTNDTEEGRAKNRRVDFRIIE
jgi:outer membrane protein OmpA-like peptidoglycan-associated protein